MFKKISKLMLSFILVLNFTAMINASGYWVTSEYYFQHNPLTYNARNNKVQNVFRSTSIKNNKTWNSLFMDGYNSYESKDSSGSNKRNFNLNIMTTNISKVSNVDVYLVDDKKNPDRFGVVEPCKINNKGKHSCSKNYINDATVHYYKLYINRYAHDKGISNVALRKKEARLTSAHELGHTLGMGHYTYKNKSISKSENSIMSYADATYSNHILKAHDIKRLVKLYGK